MPFNSAGLSALASARTKGLGVAVEAPATDEGGWKEFAGLPGTTASPAAAVPAASASAAPSSSPSSSAASPVPSASTSATASLDTDVSYDAAAASTSSAVTAVPYTDVTLAATAAPSVSSQYPPDNTAEPTLTPELIASSTSSGTLTYYFAVYSSSGSQVANSGSTWLSTPDWTIPEGDLTWDQTYYWTVAVNSGTESTTSSVSWFTTPVPQPLVTSSLSQVTTGPGFNPQTGDWTTSATDADVATAGPALEIVRDYNSEDPRVSGAFGAGWSSVLDMAVRPGQQDSAGTTQTEVVTTDDGAQDA